MSDPNRPRVALVLAGGGARGAYEAGVLRYICEELPRDTGVKPWFDIVSGTSVGALNACFVAATADDLEHSLVKLWDRWLELRADVLLKIRPLEVLRFARSMIGGAPMRVEDDGSGVRRGGLIDTSELERFVLDSVQWTRIARNIASRALHAVSVSATHVASGKTVVFVETADELPPWSRDPYVRAQRATITPWHALASAAIPMLFPPMMIDGDWYVDGGLRQNTPLSPALRLGADRVLLVSLRFRGGPTTIETPAPVTAVPSPFFLAGKALNALLIDRVEYDLDRLRRMNAIVDAGCEMMGPDFLTKINERIAGVEGAPLRRIREIHVRPSVDLGAIASAYAKSDSFAITSGLSARIFRSLAERDAGDDSDLLSYLLFDGGFGKILLELGREDARARKHELAEFFAV
jgi:NTE family protein